MGAPPFASVVDIKYQLADQIPDQDGKYANLETDSLQGILMMERGERMTLS